jgi:5'-nucleotidase
VEYLATHIAQKKATNPNTLVVSAGDLIGASPLLSALFHDEPTIEAMNLLGLDFNAVGNHEFDEGAAELLRMQHGGCHPPTAAWTATGSPAPTSSSWPPTSSAGTTARRCFPPTRSAASAG